MIWIELNDPPAKTWMITFSVTFVQNHWKLFYVCVLIHTKHAYVLTLTHLYSNSVPALLYCEWFFVVFLCTFLPVIPPCDCSLILQSTVHLYILFLHRLVNWLERTTLRKRSGPELVQQVHTVCVIICIKLEMLFPANVSSCMQRVTSTSQ